MASAAAVGANVAIPPEGSSEGGILAVNGVASVVTSKDDDVPNDLLGQAHKRADFDAKDDDDHDGLLSKKAEKDARIERLEDEDKDGHMEVEDDLFGDDAEIEDDDAQPKRRLDDRDLDSGDDLGRDDRAASEVEDGEQEEQQRELSIQMSELSRQPLPEPSDGELYLLKIPKFMSIEPVMFDMGSFQVPHTEHHSRKEPSSTFSSFATAMSTMRWRHSPSDPEKLQSNARILSWSDGSLTLQLASDPSQQFDLDGKPLAPQQRNPAKPTPTSLKKGTRDSNVGESYTYLATPEASAGLLRTAHKITAGLTIMPSASSKDDAEERLQYALAAAVQGRNMGRASGIQLQAADKEDPEKKKREVEAADKMKARTQKRKDAADERLLNGPRARGGLARSAGGLTAGMLEDDDTSAPARKPARRRPRNDEYSDDEDLGRRKGNFAADEYEVDDFVAGSDEEIEEEEDAAGDDDDESEEGLTVAKAASPKRSSKEVVDEDAAGEEDDEELDQAPKKKQRRVIADDDDDE